MLDSDFLFCSLTTRDVDRVLTFKKKCNSKESCNTVARTAVKMVSLQDSRKDYCVVGGLREYTAFRYF